MNIKLKLSNIKKAIKAKFTDLGLQIAKKLVARNERRHMTKIATQFPDQDIRPIVDDNHEIRIHASRIPTDLGKVLEIKPVSLHNKNGDVKLWYTSKKEDSSGVTEYEIRDDKQTREEFKRHFDTQHKKNDFGYGS